VLSLLGRSSSSQAEGFKGIVEFLAERHVMLIQGADVLWRTAGRPHDAGQKWLDDLVTEDQVGTHRSDTLRFGFIAARPNAAPNQVLATPLVQIMGGVTGRIDVGTPTPARCRTVSASCASVKPSGTVARPTTASTTERLRALCRSMPANRRVPRKVGSPQCS